MCDLCGTIKKSLAGENPFFVNELEEMKANLLTELNKYEI